MIALKSGLSGGSVSDFIKGHKKAPRSFSPSALPPEDTGRGAILKGENKPQEPLTLAALTLDLPEPRRLISLLYKLLSLGCFVTAT